MILEQYFNNFGNEVKDPSLNAMKYFMDVYNDFQQKMNFIHIAGTNGKGSCTEIISNILINQGYKVGKFISPHLIKYNERISINKKEISDAEILALIKELSPIIDKYKQIKKVNVTLFELETIMALLHFYRNNTDFAILETGLGGLYDCTNIISHPLVSIITSIGYDHIDILGNTLPEIAYQKAGIIKDNSHTILFNQPSEINKIFIDICRQKNNILHIVTKDKIKNYRYDDNYQYFDYQKLDNITTNLKGEKQVQNISLCIDSLDVLKKLGFSISTEIIRKSLISIIHKGRMEKINTNPLIIYDGAHNVPAIRHLQSIINSHYKNFKRVYIISILKTKDHENIIKLLLQDKNAIFIFTSGNDVTKYTSGEKLYQTATKYSDNNIHIKSLNEAIESIFNTNNKSDNIVNFITGSFYIYGDVISKINKIKKYNNC